MARESIKRSIKFINEELKPLERQMDKLIKKGSKDNSSTGGTGEEKQIMRDILIKTMKRLSKGDRVNKYDTKD